MKRLARPTFLLTAFAALFLLPGCPAWTRFCKAVRLCGREEWVDPVTVPPDFKFILKGDNKLDPPIDYLLTIERSGQAEYQIVIREPKRIVREGRFEVTEGQIVKLWDTIRAAQYRDMPPRYPDSGDGPDKNFGIQSFSVQSLGYPKEVQAHYHQDPSLERIRMTAVSLVPADVLENSLPQGTVSTTGQVIGDSASKRFYAPTSPLLKDVPESRRQVFASWYDALNYGYDPGADWRTPSATDR